MYLLHDVSRFAFACLSKFYLCLQVEGRHYIPEYGGFIVVCNHSSLLDPILIGVACPRRLNYMAKQSLFGSWFFGGILKAVGAFPVRQWSSDIKAVKEAVQRLKRGGGILMFPEGTRGAEGIIRPLSKGFLLLAQKADVPIVPARIFGSESAMKKGGCLIKPAKLKIVFSNPVFIDGNDSYNEAADNVRKKMEALSERAPL